MAAGDWNDMLYAAEKGDVELVEYHLRQGENPNYQHPEFMTTPLIESARNGHLAVVKLLLSYQADPTIKAGFGTETAIHAAKAGNHKEIVNLLKSHL